MCVQIKFLMSDFFRVRADLCNELFGQATLPCRRCNKDTRKPRPEFWVIRRIVLGQGGPSEELTIFQSDHSSPVPVILAIFEFSPPIMERLCSELIRELFMQPQCECVAIVHVIAQQGRLEHVINPREEQVVSVCR